MKFYLHIIFYIVLLSACSYNEQLELSDVVVQLSAPEGTSAEIISGITVRLTDGNAKVTESETDSEGKALFHVPVGLYHVSASVVKVVGDEQYIINGNVAEIIVSAANREDASRYMKVVTPVIITKKGAHSLIIKEIYCGGCQKNDGSGIFSNDKCIILYNNSPFDTEIANIAIGLCEPYNAEAGGHNFLNNGVLDYETAGIMPALNGIWYFPDTLRLKAYEEMVINVHGAIDNTKTYKNSINYANPDYYCMYDPTSASSDGKTYNNTSYYPSPAEVIPTSHYLKAVKYGQGNAWALSQTSPAVFLFQTKGITPKEYAEDASNIIFPKTQQGKLAYACLSVPREWIIDGVEVYNGNKLADCKKRLTADIDNGYVVHHNGQGHSLLRRIDEAATAKAGKTVYIDTNNSSNDFMEAEKCSLR